MWFHLCYDYPPPFIHAIYPCEKITCAFSHSQYPCQVILMPVNSHTFRLNVWNDLSFCEISQIIIILFNLQPWSSILFITKLTMNSYEHLACIDFTYCYLLLGEFYDGGNADQKGEYFWLFMLLIPHSFPFLVCFFTSSFHFRDSEANAWFARGTGCWNKWWSS